MDFFTRVTTKSQPFVKSSRLTTSAKDEFEEVHSDTSSSSDWDLDVDVYNTPSEIVIVAMLAGVDAQDLGVKVKEDVLVLTGTRNKPQKLQDIGEYLYEESLHWGSFEKLIILPPNIRLEKIQAKLDKEKILYITLPKIERDDEQVVRVEFEE